MRRHTTMSIQNHTIDEMLEVRSTAAILAATLWIHYKSRDLSVPSFIEKWREVSLSPDEFAEIRNAWEDCGKVLLKR